MPVKRDDPEVLASKDGENERPIPTAWRPIIKEIVHALVRHDYRLTTGISQVAPVSDETAEQVKDYIEDYGAELIELPDETWASSVCIWMGDRWDALIDLWTRSEGRSDLVLSIQAREAESEIEFNIYMVYVP